MMLVKVTQKHIDEGKRADCYTCPIALAILDIDPKPVNVQVKYSYVMIYIEKNGKYKQYELPWEAREFISKFDNGKKVEPFEFELVV